MNRTLKIITFTLFIFTSNLFAGFLPAKIYKSFESTLKDNVESIGMEKPNYDAFIIEGKEEILVTPQQREEFIKKQFLKKEDILAVDEVVKEEISIEMEATQFFDSLNKEHTKPVDME